MLQIDSAKANTFLNWRPVWDFDAAVRHTANWYQRWLEDGSASSVEQLSVYLADARSRG
jgi:CDP-glucose 4,6-dehydratase